MKNQKNVHCNFDIFQYCLEQNAIGLKNCDALEKKVLFSDLSFPTERREMQSTELDVTKGKFSVLLEVTIGRFPENCSCPCRPKVDFQVESLKLLMIHLVPFRRNRQV
uniref:Uncharacterized protein n=1 Tax=Romanomermis culicivorax TaxID=13658 RepID=A0A915HYS1_ROMCU